MLCISISISFILHSRYVNVAAFFIILHQNHARVIRNPFCFLLILNLLCKFIDNS